MTQDWREELERWIETQHGSAGWETKLENFIAAELSRQHARFMEVLDGVVPEERVQYMAVKDNDGHRYRIPVSKETEWSAFCDIPSDDEGSWYVPEWAEQIDGMPVEDPTWSDCRSEVQKRVEEAKEKI